MKTMLRRSFGIAAALLSPLALAAGCTENGKLGWSEEVSRTETTKPGWFGGQTHAVNTVYKNPDGSTSIETESTTTKDGTTTIVREKKTTNLDGTVNTEHEKHVIVKGTETVVRESKSGN